MKKKSSELGFFHYSKPTEKKKKADVVNDVTENAF